MRERAFNVTMSESSTRCCVCSLFEKPNLFLSFDPQHMADTYKEISKQLLQNDGESPSRKSKAGILAPLPKPVMELRVVVQRVLINLPSSLMETQRDNTTESDDELVTCVSCGICVHKCEFNYKNCILAELFSPEACYGAPPHTGTSQWLCQRCGAGVSNDQDCCLCLLRGGALKRTDGGRWAHLVCAFTIPNVYFGNLHTKEPIVTEDIPRARRKLVRRTSSLHTLFTDHCSLYVALLFVCVSFRRCPSARSWDLHSMYTTQVLYCNACHLCSVLWAALGDCTLWMLWILLS